MKGIVCVYTEMNVKDVEKASFSLVNRLFL